MTITMGVGLGTGLDIAGIVSKLVAAESGPATNALDRRESEAQARLSALGALKGALSAFQSAAFKLKDSKIFDSLSTKSSNDAVLTASAGSGAVAGRYSITVEKLAKAETKISAAGYAATATFGSGTLSISVGAGTPIDVSITGGVNDTLSGIASAINSSAAGSSVSATVLNVDDGVGGTYSKLVLTSKSTGAANTITVNGTSTAAGSVAGGLTAFNAGGMTVQTAAQDSKIWVNGMAATRSSNTVSDVITGVTLNLNSEGLATPVILDIALDKTAISKTVNDFVTAYNSLRKVMKEQGSYDSATKSGGELLGDATLRNVNAQLRQDLGQPVTTASTNYNTLHMLGVEIDKDGIMSVNQTKLDQAVGANLNALKDVFSSADGIAVRVDARLKTYLEAGGIFDSQTTRLKDTLSKISAQRLDLENRTSLMQANLLKQFNAMDSLVASMNTTGNYLSQQLSKLPGFG